MNASRVLVVALAVFTALIVQTTVLARLPTPGGRPDLLLLVVVAFALADGSFTGLLAGFGAGLLADVVGSHAFGLLALIFCVVGYLAGRFADETRRSLVVPVLVVAGAVVGASVVYAVVLVLLGHGGPGLAGLARGLPSTVLYDVVLAPFVVPAVGALCRRLDRGARPLR